MTNPYRIPDFVPTLSPGRHRNPRKGACFMEMASYLAGERWSDHPRCTHPLLAAMAREINDRLGDGARQDLVPLIPSVVGLASDDRRIDAWIAREAALTGLPLVSMSRQRALAVGVLRCEEALAELDDLPLGSLSPRAQHTLALVPDADEWARQFIADTGGRRDAFLSRGAPAVVHQAVAGIAQACVPDPELVLVGLLRRTIEHLRQLVEVPEVREQEAGGSHVPAPVPVPGPESREAERHVVAPGPWRNAKESAVRWDVVG